MISNDQPTCFPSSVTVAVSSRSDGTMLNRTTKVLTSETIQSRKKFCQLVDFSYDNCVYQCIQYGHELTYKVIAQVTAADTVTRMPGIKADGLFTTNTGVGLFLPVADCIATVIYDPMKHYLALLHLGRHSTYADLSTCAIKYFTNRGSDPKNLLIWMSPHVGATSYTLQWFDKQNDLKWREWYTLKNERYYLDLAGYNAQRFNESGVKRQNIFISPIDTATDTQYFSHSQGDVSGRMAVLAVMK